MANNYTVSINKSDKLRSLTWEKFYAADFGFNTPFDLQLDNDSIFYAEHVLRIVPKRRLVAYGTWDGKPAVAKIFFGRQSAQQQIDKEVNGIKILQNNKIPTPEIYYQGVQDKRVHVLILEYIGDAKSLYDIWHEAPNQEAEIKILYNIIVELATQHVMGVVQKDLHLKNFLVTEKAAYTLDGAQVIQEQQLLPKAASIKNLALFLSQLGIGCEALQEKLLKHYAKSRGWLLKKRDIFELFLHIKKWNAIRWMHYSKKIFRKSSGFGLINQQGYHGMYDRNYANKAFLQILTDPERAFKDPSAVVLKAGNSTTVIKYTVNKQVYLIKRFNLKNAFHRLRRCMRETRAAKSWRLANKLALFFAPVAHPIAFVEKRFLGFRAESYFITEYIDGEHAGEYIQRHRENEEKISLLVTRVTALLKSIAKLKITHGDLKITNILVNQNNEPILIDFDGAVEYASVTSLKQAWKKEIKRLMQNFHNEPVVASKFKKAFETS